MFTLKFYADGSNKQVQQFVGADSFSIEDFGDYINVRVSDRFYIVGDCEQDGPLWSVCFIENSSGKTIHRLDAPQKDKA